MSPRFFLFLIILCLGPDDGSTQQHPVWSLFNMNKYGVNTAYAGFDRSLSINFQIRNQWNTLEGGVQSQALNAHLPLYILNGGVGISAVRDETGPLTTLKGGISYNYVYPSALGVLSFSGELGLTQVSLAGDLLRTPEGEYDGLTIDHRDDDLPVRDASAMAPDFSLSLYYKWQDLTIGLGLDNLISADVPLASGKYRYNLSRNIDLIASYDYALSSQLSLGLHGHLISDFAQTQFQFGGHISLHDNIYGGMAFRGYSAANKDALIFITGIRISEHFILFYAYDYLVSPLNLGVVNNTHEFTLNYNLNELIRTGLPPKVIYNPRF